MAEVRIETPQNIRLVRLPRVAREMPQSLERGLRRAGFYLEGEMKRKATGRPGPNVRTGRLRSSITSKLGDNNTSVTIGPSAFYAPYLELGTENMKGPGENGGYPFVGPTFDEKVDDAIDMLQKDIMRPF